MEPVSTIKKIPLDKLALSPANVRKTPPPSSADAELKASIQAHGLKQSLNVHASAEAKGHYAVIAGGRRLKALQALRDDGVIPANYAVPCQVEDAGAAVETSLVENTVRVSMHPADQFESMAGLVDAGESIAAIATRFGATEHHVRQRLKLGKVAPDLLQAYRDEEMDLEVLMAFTLTDDHDAQRSVWKAAGANQYVHANTIRRLLTDESISTTSRLGHFVGLEAYEAAGGRVSRDLFSDRGEAFMEDVELVHRLADEKLQAAAQQVAGDWSWVEPIQNADYSYTAAFGRVYPEAADLPPELEQEFQEITNREDALYDLEDLSDDQQAELDRLTERRDAIEAQLDDRSNFSEEDRKRAGCIVTIGHNGEVELRQGLVRPEDEEGAPAVAASHTAEPSREQAIRKDIGLSQVLVEDLKAHRLQITQAHLARDFPAAFDLVLYSLCRDILGRSYHAAPLELRAHASYQRSSLDDLAGTPAAQALEAQRQTLLTGWLALPPAKAFDALSGLGQEEKAALFAWCVAQTLKAQLAIENQANPVLEQIGERLGIDFPAAWRPTADNYWSRVKKAHSLEVGGAILGETWRRDHRGDKRGVLAKVLEAAFAGDGQATVGLDADTAARAAAWMPPGMAYGETDVDTAGAEDEAETTEAA